jgi:hypothetical protein
MYVCMIQASGPPDAVLRAASMLEDGHWTANPCNRALHSGDEGLEPVGVLFRYSGSGLDVLLRENQEIPWNKRTESSDDCPSARDPQQRTVVPG